MAFNVTQCPGCESTFNTNARMLELAAGKVRCGACLKVFDATQHYLQNLQDDDHVAGEESVFLSDDPQDYFDPSNFLTRSALTESDSLEDGQNSEQSQSEYDGDSFSARDSDFDDVELREEIIPETEKDEETEIEDLFTDSAKNFHPADVSEDSLESSPQIGTEFSDEPRIDEHSIDESIRDESNIDEEAVQQAVQEAIEEGIEEGTEETSGQDIEIGRASCRERV